MHEWYQPKKFRFFFFFGIVKGITIASILCSNTKLMLLSKRKNQNEENEKETEEFGASKNKIKLNIQMYGKWCGVACHECVDVQFSKI